MLFRNVKNRLHNFLLIILLLAMVPLCTTLAEDSGDTADRQKEEIQENQSAENQKNESAKNGNKRDRSEKPDKDDAYEGRTGLSDDYNPEYLISTRYAKSKSGNVTTWYLMYTRSKDIFDTLKDLFDDEMRSGDVKISENPVTNSIIIRAKENNSPVVNEILDTVKSLDFRSGQVLIEVLVVELSVSDEDLFDFELMNIVKEPLNIKNTLGTIGVDHGTIGESDPLSKSDRLKIFVTTPNRMKLFLNAYKDAKKANIISSPHIVAANHREATFKIGNKVPIIDSIRPSDSGPIKSFDIKEVGIELTVTPHINRGNQIDLEVFQTINALQSYDAKEGTANMSNREVQTNVSLADGETLILGGFIEERSTKTENRIPVLGELPLVGKAFRKKQNNKEKIELLIFLTPKILDTVEDAKVALKDKIDKVSFKDRVQELVGNMRIKKEKLAPDQEYLIERASRDWLYDYDRKDIEDLVWDIPLTVDASILKLRRHGHMPFGFGQSKRLKPPRLNTELVPSEGFVMSKDFNVDEPEKIKSMLLHVASNNAAVVYINGQLVDQDPAMKLKDGHDFEYWNRTVENIPGSLLRKGANTVVVFLGCDSSASDAYLDIELIGSRS